jgi:hypothetical protein
MSAQNKPTATSKALICVGACKHHEGDVVAVLISGWGIFNYCQVAIKEDRSRGLFVSDIDAIAKAEGGAA